MSVSLVYMVAGLSSRFGGKIKQFARVGPNHEMLIECSLKQALPAGFSKIIFIVGEKTEKPFKKLFKNRYRNIPVHYALQNYDKKLRDKPWGTGDALCSAKQFITEPYVVCNGDDLYGEESFDMLVNHLKQSNENAALGFKLENVLPENGKVNRAIFELDDQNYVSEIKEVFNIEKADLPENLSKNSLASMNIFALEPEVIKKLDARLQTFKQVHKNDRKIEYLLPQELSALIKNNEITMKCYKTNAQWLGITNPEDEAIVKEKLQKNE